MNDKILLIEDNDDDVLMIQRALRKGKIGSKLHRSVNGKEGLEYLDKEESNTIELILLDLNMEVMNGFDFLKTRIENARIKKIPVVVLTSSHREEDIHLAYELGANAFIQKPLDPKEFIEVILKIENFWIDIVKKSL
jgi:CheY-like chemotaxis protein